MRKNIKFALGLLTFLIIASGCEKLLEVNSNQLVLADKHKLDSPNEIVYSMIGILTQLEKVSDRYVLLGELRGDLMEVTERAGSDLQEIYNFSISRDNPYNNLDDYYAVINNCNYLINYIDTSIVSNAEKVMYREYTAAKAIRAWTCMQIALNYGSVTYLEEPVLFVEDAFKTYPEYTIDELAPILIRDLEPLRDIPAVVPISLGEDITSENLFFPVRFLLGDLYLWTGEYEKAAQEYRDLMFLESHLITNRYQSDWEVINGVFVKYEPDWSMIFDLVNSEYEQITMIAGSTQYGRGSSLDSICLNFQVAPSGVSLNHWNNQLYYHTATVVNQGDLREMSSYFPGGFKTTDFGRNLNDDMIEEGMISKFYHMSTATSKGIHVYRSGLLYLRYAEAVNRTGKPNAAFAVLKHGMKGITFTIDTIVPAREKFTSLVDSSFHSYLNFSDPRFNNNIGVHARGCGNVHLAKDFIIPSLPGLQDSINYVEDKIIEELALETAFEGNRFHDLMRVALRKNDPAYLADRVSAKYDSGTQAAIRSRLMNTDNWYLSR